MAVTPKILNWFGIVLGLGNKFTRKVVDGQNILEWVTIAGGSEPSMYGPIR